ncbi:hypothetical protein OPIT5_00385 (plasmid) [Opitutaceae bacterium TAV5]|nr:hypothetical protein OPIT5_00385 [Opitutaceae bacterium TAV5]
MTRYQYALYLVRRTVEALAIVALAVVIVHLLQRNGTVSPASHDWALKSWNAVAFWQNRQARKARVFRVIEWWTIPALAGLVAHLIIGPKQKRPIYLKTPNTMFAYGGVRVDRNAGCRGGQIYGATGTGKTQIVINPRNHSIAINECGVEKPSWAKSRARAQFEAIRQTFREQTAEAQAEINRLVRERERLAARIEPVQDRLLDELFDAINSYQRKNPTKPFTACVFGDDAEDTPPEVRLHTRNSENELEKDWTKVWLRSGAGVTPEDALRLLSWARAANRFGVISRIPACGSQAFQTLLQEYAGMVAEDNRLNEKVNELGFLIQVKRNDLQRFADGIKDLRYRVPPYGALVLGAKGNEWQATVPMLRHYNRDEDICLLQTRPSNAPDTWTPPAQFNLISYHDLPAPTYAQLLINTYATISHKDKMDYFDNSARDQIGYGIELLRAITQDQGRIGVPEDQRVIPNLKLVCEIFTSLNNYNTFLLDLGAAPREIPETYIDNEKQPDGTYKRVEKTRVKKINPVLTSSRIAAARKEIEGGYWGLAPETQQSVMGTIRNVLVPFTEADVAEVFCETNTFDLREIESGKVICVAMPPKYSVQRQYVGTILKNLVFTIINNRFDLSEGGDGRPPDPRWKYRNLVIVDSDEHQISAGKEDERVDIIRQANGTLYGASQTRNALWKTYGGKEAASPILANLRNVWACQAGSDECAEETSKLIGEAIIAEHSYSSGRGGTNTSYREKPLISKAQIKSLSPFHVFWIPAEGKWLYKLLIAMPVTPDARIPSWWFGDWNLLHWFFYYASLPPALFGIRLHPGHDFIPPWHARAPWRAQLRYLCGLDGTFIIIRKMKRRKAEKMATPKHQR